MDRLHLYSRRSIDDVCPALSGSGPSCDDYQHEYQRRPANRTGLLVLNAWRDLACTEPSLAGIAVRLHALIARSGHPERFVTALLVNFPVEGLR